MPRRKIPPIEYHIAHPTKIVVGVIAIGLSIILIVSGITIMEFSDLLKQSVEQHDYSIPKKSEIDFRDVEPLRSWMKEAEITSTDDKSLEVGATKRFSIIVDSPNPPQELVVHIYHEDMNEFFINEDDPSAFRQLSKQLNRVPTLEYGSIFDIEFNMIKYWECADHTKSSKDECNQLLQVKDTGTFTMPGKYFVQFSAKINESSFEHRKSPGILTEIPNPREIELGTQITDLRKSTELQRAEAKNSLGVAYMAIGTAMFFSGLSLVLPSNVYKTSKKETSDKASKL